MFNLDTPEPRSHQPGTDTGITPLALDCILRDPIESPTKATSEDSSLPYFQFLSSVLSNQASPQQHEGEWIENLSPRDLVTAADCLRQLGLGRIRLSSELIASVCSALVEQLGSEDVHEREFAQESLRSLGRVALPWLIRTHSTTSDAEVRRASLGLIREQMMSNPIASFYERAHEYDSFRTGLKQGAIVVDNPGEALANRARAILESPPVDAQSLTRPFSDGSMRTLVESITTALRRSGGAPEATSRLTALRDLISGRESEYRSGQGFLANNLPRLYMRASEDLLVSFRLQGPAPADISLAQQGLMRAFQLQGDLARSGEGVQAMRLLMRVLDSRRQTIDPRLQRIFTGCGGNMRDIEVQRPRNGN